MSVLDQNEKEPNISKIVELLDEVGVVNVEVYFDGCGDSGDIHTVTAYSTKQAPYEAIELDNSLVAQIEAWVYARLEQCGVDWYNNDGGFGDYTFSKDDKGVWRYDFTVNTRYTQVDCEHHEEDKELIPTLDKEEELIPTPDKEE